MNWSEIYIKYDAGRSKSSRPKQKNDCVVRAIAVAASLSYDDAYDLLAARGRKACRRTPKDVWKGLLHQLGFPKTVFPAEKGKARLTLYKFCLDNPQGRWVVQCAGHLVAVVAGHAYDDVEPRKDACVYAAWRC